jgi:glycosyltransferase involved in cell wall biosynthesis
VAETLPLLSRGAEIEIVCEDPAAVDAGLRERFRVRRAGEETVPDLDVYHVGNSPAHAYAYRAARARPGVAVLHDWSLHYAVLGPAVAAGDFRGYLRAMRQSYRDVGEFVGRQMAAALGSEAWASLYPLNERLLDRSLAVVSLSRMTAERAQRAHPAQPVLHLPLHVAPPPVPLTQAEARRALGLPETALVVTAPGLATASKGLDAAMRAVARLASRFPELRLVVAGGVSEDTPVREWAAAAGLSSRVLVTGRLPFDDFMRHLAAADVVLALRFPSFGEMSATLVRAMGLGRAVLVTRGTPLADEMPEGTVVPVDPGPYQDAEMTALLERLLADRPLRETIGALAREHAESRHDLAATVAALLDFLRDVRRRAPELRAATENDEEAGSLLGYFQEEIRWCARDLGIAGLPLGIEDALASLAAGRPR